MPLDAARFDSNGRAGFITGSASWLLFARFLFCADLFCCLLTFSSSDSFDENMSFLEGSINVLPIRVMVLSKDYADAQMILKQNGISML